MKKLKQFIKYFINQIKINESDFASAFLAYHLLLSFIPLLIFLSQALIYVAPGFKDSVYELMNSLPNDVTRIFLPVIDNIFNSQSSSLSIIAIGSTIWLGSRGFLGLIKSLNKIFSIETKDKIPFFEKIFSIFYTIAFMLLLASLLLFSVFNEKIVDVIQNITNNLPLIKTISNILINGIGRLMPAILSIIIFIFFYRYAPSFNKENRIKFLPTLIGASITTIGISLITFFYKFTNDTLSKSNSVYGSLGSILVTLVWLLAICQMIIYGALFIKTYIVVIKNDHSLEDTREIDNSKIKVNIIENKKKDKE